MDEYQEQKILHTSHFSKAYLTLKSNSVTLYAKKCIIFPSNIKFENEEVECFKNICNKLKQLDHPCSMKISYFTLPDIKPESSPSIYTVFTPNYSLQDTLEEHPNELIDKTQEMIILYGVSQYINHLHKNAVHGRLKASNVLLDPKLYPLVSDPFFYELYQKIPKSDLPKTLDNTVFLSKETLSEGKVNSKTDIYSFGILALQALTHQINVFSNISDDIDEIEKNILKGVKPQIPDFIQGDVRNLIEKCLSDDPEQRPDASYLVETLQKELSNEQVYDKNRVDLFQQYLDQKIKEEEEEEENEQKQDQTVVQETDANDQFEKKIINYLDEKNVVFANEDLKRLKMLYNYLEDGNMVSLVGPKGEIKSLSSHVVCEFSGRRLIHFVLNSSTSFRDFMKRSCPFITAFENGHTLLLEIDRANSRCHQFIIKTLNDGFIKIPGVDEKIYKHKDFRLITTQDSDFGTDLTNLAKIINFSAYTKNDLIEMGQKLAKKIKCNCSRKLIEDLVEFDIKWSELENSLIGNNELFSFRRITATIRAISENENLYEAVMMIYGSRHSEENRKKLQEIFTSYQSFKFLNLNQHDYPENTPEAYKKPWFLFTLQSILYYFNHKRLVILTAEKYVDVNDFAKWVAEYYDEVQKMEKVQKAVKVQVELLGKQMYCEIKENVLLLCKCNLEEIQRIPHDFIISKFDVVYLEDKDQINKEQLRIEEEYRQEQLRKEELRKKFISTCTSIVQLIKDSIKAQENNKKYLCCIDRSSFAKTDEYGSYGIPLENLFADEVLKRLSEYGSENIDVYFWDSSIYHSNSIDVEFLTNANNENHSELIANICEQSSIRDHLIIFASRCSDISSIDESDRRMKSNGIRFNQVITYVVGEKGGILVGAPYSRNYPSTNCGMSFSKEDMDALNAITNISTYNVFNSKYKNLYNAILAKTLGTEGDIELRDKLISISPRIRITCIDIKQKNNFDNMMKSLLNMALGALRKCLYYESIKNCIQQPSDEIVINEEATNFFQMAANKSDINSIISYANILKKRDNKQEAVRYYKIATDNENVTAMGIYAEMLYFGIGISQNKPEAVSYLKTAAENGYQIDSRFFYTFKCFGDMANSHGSSGNLWCIDCSGSVGFELYHNEIRHLLSKYRQPNDDFYLWESNIHHTSSLGMDIFVETHAACGGTLSELIADCCEQSSIRDHLIIITDGGVWSDSIDESDWRMYINGIKFKHVTTYVIGNGGNLSVGAPYSRNCPSITYRVEEVGCEIPVTSLTKEDIEALESISNINTYNTFNSKYNNLHSAIRAKTLGTKGDQEIQDELSSLSPRIKKSGINDEEKKDFKDKMKPLENMALGAIREQFTVEKIETTIQRPTEEVAITKEAAANYFKMGANKGDVDSMTRYANIVKDGNKQEASHYYKMAADNGDEASMYNYADMLLRGDGVAVNKKEAARYFKMAADKGNANACIAYAFLLKHGEGVSANKSESANYFKMAADNGDSKMKIFYAYMLKKGDGVPANEQEAKKYFKQAGVNVD